jgi:hypothetical protein
MMRDRKRSERGEHANRGTGEFAYLMQRGGWFPHRMIKHLSTNQKGPPQLGGLFPFLSGTNVIEVTNLRQVVRITKTALGNRGGFLPTRMVRQVAEVNCITSEDGHECVRPKSVKLAPPPCSPPWAGNVNV